MFIMLFITSRCYEERLFKKRTDSVNYQFIYITEYICMYLISWFIIITVVRVNMVHSLLLIKMNSLTADDRCSDAQVFSIFNPPTLWYSKKELGNSFPSLVRKRWERNVGGNHILLLH